AQNLIVRAECVVMVQQQQTGSAVGRQICFVVVDGNGAAIQVGINRQTCQATSHVEAGISRIVRASCKRIDGPGESTTRRGDAIVEFGIGRRQTEGRSVHRNNYLVGVVNHGFETRRSEVVDETIQSERAQGY